MISQNYTRTGSVSSSRWGALTGSQGAEITWSCLAPMLTDGSASLPIVGLPRVLAPVSRRATQVVGVSRHEGQSGELAVVRYRKRGGPTAPLSPFRHDSDQTRLQGMINE